ncbi:HPr family phosphocarrier protein [Halanaerobium saccharolyticum]|jgi:phosphocarrier protein|uniref:Phosphocarrier protein HPr n=1 Tax=Halanaerobium saccharolyticum TaxID=43595 RepID=A0A2T5RI42_9FIRM|nr:MULTISPECIES: HPr family phosphocarrier protein [Halanaerobium]PTV97795.1 phosphocarrier protein [Halanaerobium saccharolyticum]PUU87219.1 MAG: phosphocarrier protein [Halanaerobium sp.]PUU93614.1 MAG: phosphocarrier protein [Halanaerobium sp.]TDP88668.1 phosphocarrier protein [Halanaerobium saccharolyticum]
MTAEKTLTINNETGLHARPASQLVKKAGNFKSQIEIIVGEKEVNAKSIMGIMSLGLGKGDEITLKAEGEDADAAVEGLTEFIEVELLEH